MFTKPCVACGEVKPFADFYAEKGMKDGYRNDCKRCNLARAKARYDSGAAVARAKAWRKANPERARQSQRRHHERNRERIQKRQWAQRHQVPHDQIDHWWALRDAPCAICKRTDESLHFDHDHATNLGRGWLCGRCNRGLGMYLDDPALLRAAAQYLEGGR